MKRLSCFLFVLSMCGGVALGTTFNKHFHNSLGIDSALSLPDGGVLLAGGGGPGRNPQPVLLRLNRTGKILWCFQYHLGEGYYGSFRKTITAETPETFYVIGERARISNDEADPLLLKINAQGAILWKRAIVERFSDYFYDLTRTPEGVAVAGITGSFGLDRTAAWMLHFSRSGALDFAKAFDRGFEDYFRGILPTGDGGYLLAGTTDNFAAAEDGTKALVTKVSRDGSYQWHKMYSGGNGANVNIFAAARTPDNNFVLVGDYSQPDRTSDALILKINASGEILWKKALGGAGTEDALSVHTLANGDVAIVGETIGSLSPGWDGFFALFSSAGVLRWSRIFGADFDDDLRAVSGSNDGGFVLLGSLYTPFVPSASDFSDAVMKVNSVGLLDLECSVLRKGRLPTKAPVLAVPRKSLFVYPIDTATFSLFISRIAFRPQSGHFCK